MATRDVTIRELVATYHRNGVGGVGFKVGLFIDPDEGPMLFITFVDDEQLPEARNHGYTAVLRLSDLVDIANHDRTVDEISAWRGDVYEAEIAPLLDEALDRHFKRIGA